MQHPAILALVLSSLIICGMVTYAAFYGVRILRGWDPESGSEGQLALERRTYLVATLLSYGLAFQTMSLFLYIYTADSIHPLFTGAMCAAGSLSVNSYGYPVLILKTANCILAGVWLLINGVDTRGYDYPLIRPKYALLLLLAVTIILEALLQYVYFSGLRADVITSCCGSLFSGANRGIAAEISGIPAIPAMLMFTASILLCMALGFRFLLSAKGAYLFSGTSIIFFIVALASLVSFISPYFYELPTHHCPFCILQKEYGYVGYLLYACLLGGVITGTGVGALAPFRERASLSHLVPVIQGRLARITLLLFFIFTATVAWRISSTSFTLGIFR